MKSNNIDGGIRQRKNGLWEKRYYLKGKRCSVYGKTKEDAIEAYNLVMKSVQYRIENDPKSITYDEYFHEYIKTLTNVVKPQSIMELSNVRKRSDGLLVKRIRIKDEEKYIYGKTIDDIIEKEKKIHTDARRGYDTSLRRLSLCEYFKHWYDIEINNRISPATKFNYDYCYRWFLEPFFKDMKIVKVDKYIIDQFRQEIYKKYSYQTMRSVLNQLKRMFNYAIVEGVVTNNPVLQLRPLRKKEQVKITDTIHRALTLEEEKLFFYYCKEMGEWHYESMLFSIATGVRLGELRGLKWKDVDYDNNKVIISRSYAVPPRYKPYVKEPKTRAGFRDIPLNELSIEALKSQEKKMKKHYGAKVLEPESFIFRNKGGGLPDSADFGDAINKVLSEIQKKEGIIIPHFSHHAFRNTFATRFIENGGTLQTLKTILGHSTYRLTADLYVHVLPNTKQSEMDTLDAYIYSEGVCGDRQTW